MNRTNTHNNNIIILMCFNFFRFDFKENPQFIVMLFVRWRRCAKHVRQVKIFITEFRRKKKIYIYYYIRENG